MQILAATPSEKFFFDGTGSPFAGDGSAFTQDGVIKLSGDTYVTVSRGTGLVRVH